MIAQVVTAKNYYVRNYLAKRKKDCLDKDDLPDKAALTQEANEKWEALNEGHSSWLNEWIISERSSRYEHDLMRAVADERGPYDKKSADTNRCHLLA